MTLEIDIYSDVVCPWCYIGKRRLDRLIARGEVGDVSVRWRPFQLYPGLPPEGVNRAEFLGARGRSGAREQLASEAEEIGIEMRFERIERLPNTLAAHRLLYLAGSRYNGRLQHDLAEDLFSAYFCEGKDVGDPDELVQRAAAVGIPAALAAQYLASTEDRDVVQREIEQARAAGISGVPCFMLGGVFALPGAQAEDTLAQVIERARSRLANAG